MTEPRSSAAHMPLCSNGIFGSDGRRGEIGVQSTADVGALFVRGLDTVIEERRLARARVSAAPWTFLKIRSGRGILSRAVVVPQLRQPILYFPAGAQVRLPS